MNKNLCYIVNVSYSYVISTVFSENLPFTQIHERARQGRLRAKFMREIRFSVLVYIFATILSNVIV